MINFATVDALLRYGDIQIQNVNKSHKEAFEKCI
jgi:hypothetical protein